MRAVARDRAQEVLLFDRLAEVDPGAQRRDGVRPGPLVSARLVVVVHFDLPKLRLGLLGRVERLLVRLIEGLVLGLRVERYGSPATVSFVSYSDQNSVKIPSKFRKFNQNSSEILKFKD